MGLVIRSGIILIFCLGHFGCQSAPKIDYRQTQLKLDKSENLIKEKKYAEAETEVKEAIAMNPDSATLITQLGRINVLTKNYTEAEKNLSKALDMEPWSPATHEYFATMYSDQGDYKKALESNLKAHNLVPEDWARFADLGNNYLKLNDLQNAQKFFMMYLKSHAPGEKKKEVLQTMKDAKIEVLPFQSPVEKLISEKKFNDAEDLLKELQKNKTPDQNGDSELFKAYISVTRMIDAKPLLEEWYKRNPKSAFASSLLGLWTYDYAFEGRGRGPKQALSEENLKLFEERLAHVNKYLVEANTIDSTNLLTVAGLIGASKTKKSTRSEEKKIFLAATKQEPDNYFLQQQMLSALMPKWGGNQKELFLFARFQADRAPKSKAPLLVPYAHWELANELYHPNQRMHFKNPEVWAECKKELDKVVYWFPDSIEARTLYLRTAMYAGYPREARLQYEKIKDRLEVRYWMTPREVIQIQRMMEMGAGM